MSRSAHSKRRMTTLGPLESSLADRRQGTRVRPRAELSCERLESRIEMTVTITASNPAVMQNPSQTSIPFVLTRTGTTSELAQETQVAYNTVDGTAIAGVNYTATSRVATFAPNQTQVTINVPLIYNATATSNLTLGLQLPQAVAIAALYQNTFPPNYPATTTVGANPSAALGGDFNHDGISDLAVANTGSNSVSILLGQGNGNFSNPVNYPVGTAPDGIAAADFNHDGFLDLAVANKGSNNVSILLGGASGSFKPGTSLTGVTSPAAIAAGDLNGDGTSDLAVTSSTGEVLVFLGQAGGGFATPTPYTVGTDPRAVVLQDFNQDGRLDIAVANHGSNDVSVLLNSALTGLAPAVNYQVGNGPIAMVAGNFNSDGYPDLAVANETDKSVVPLMSQGSNGTFLLGTPVPLTQVPGSLTAVTGASGLSDLLVTEPQSGTLLTLQNQGTSAKSLFLAAGSYATGSGPVAAVVGNFNQQGGYDVAVVNKVSGTVATLLGQSGGLLGAGQSYTTTGTAAGLAVADFNLDGIPDQAVANNSANSISVILSQTNGGYAQPVDYAVGANPVAVASGDLTKTGRQSLVVVNKDANTISVLIGQLKGAFAPAVNYTVGASPVGAAIADFNADGIPDIAVANEGSSAISVLLGKGDGSFDAPINIGLGNAPSSIVTADFNGDGKPDLAVTSKADNLVNVLLGQGTQSLPATFSPPVSYAVGSGPVALVAASLRGTGNPDLIVANQGSGNVSVLLNQGSGTFAAAANYVAGTLPTSVTSGDVNGDGILDVVVGNGGSNDASILLGQGNGTLAPAQPFSVGGSPTGVALASPTTGGLPTLFTTVNNGAQGSLNSLFNSTPLLSQPTFNLVGGTGKLVQQIPAVAAQIMSVQRFGYNKQPTQVTLGFNQSLDPVTAGNVANYQVFWNGKRIPVQSVVVGVSQRTVTLKFASALPVHRVYKVVVNGTNSGVQNVYGFPIGTDVISPNGRNLVTQVNARTLAGPASAVRYFGVVRPTGQAAAQLNARKK